MGSAFAELASNDVHYKMLKRIRFKPRAVEAYMDRILHQSPGSEPSEDEVKDAEDATPEEERMIADFKDKYGSHLKRYSDSGILPRSVLNALQNTHAAITPGTFAVSLVFAKRSASAFSRAAAATAR
eukprot:CAMPEP_0168358066 /NCGR_PEP_ID=MMETSP0228-20121227/917_1 /TAXON_ID=133427 /ORGANISM="Protoceratium reticulatum, Strain CCCM 535 (=CCMP 1889)" /LENGTH=126 /DNA_ID=CAMNT_0008370617 /DNA_START=171 /DNA_END=548 /DNA_ORIENTATION=-